MTRLERDLAANRMELRESHSRMVLKVTALLACDDMRTLDCLSAASTEAIGLGVVLEMAEIVEGKATDLLERATDRLEEIEEKA